MFPTIGTVLTPDFQTSAYKLIWQSLQMM
jgi:hypothetical protein